MKSILIVNIGQRQLLAEKAILAALIAKHDCVIAEEQGPPAPTTDFLVQDFSQRFKEMLSPVHLNVNAPTDKDNQPFYMGLAKYRRKNL